MKFPIGKPVLIRSYASGVHYGILLEVDEKVDRVVLTDARRIWYWEGAFTLSGVLAHGVNANSKFSIRIPQIAVFGVNEIMPLSDEVYVKLNEVPAHDTAR